LAKPVRFAAEQSRLGIASVLLAAAVMGCGKPPAVAPVSSAAPATQSTPADEDQADAVQTDRDAEKSLSEPGSFEARAWLAQPHHSTFKVSHDLAEQTVDDFYSAGATNVWVAGVENIDISQVAAEIIVQIPTDPAARGRVFDVMREVDKNSDEEPTKDLGQMYFVISCD
jgi:hypothetical protein